MNILLTRNGIKPATVAQIEQPAMDNIVALTSVTRGNQCSVSSLDSYRDIVTRADQVWQAVVPFSKIVLAIIQGFQEWGAELNYIRHRSLLNNLKQDEASIKFSTSFHRDYGLSRLADGEGFYVRILCASSLPLCLLDPTGPSNLSEDIKALGNDTHAIEDYAESKGIAFKARPTDVIIFDGGTWHRAYGAKECHDRALLTSDIKMIMPDDTMARIRRGNKPKLDLAACKL